MLKMLDCFCGLGGASEGFAKEGFECTGIDIKYVGYHYNFIYKDIRLLDGKDFQGYDVIWGSPPCRDFSQYAILGANGWGTHKIKGKWKIPPNPERGLLLVKSFLKLVEDAKPKIWIMENVNNLSKYLELEPRITNAKIKGGKSHVFYGNFPNVVLPHTDYISMNDVSGKLRSWERAKIPLACSQAFARVCKEKLSLSLLK